VSGAIEAKGVSACCRVSVTEASYAFGETPPPSADYMEGQIRSWRSRLATIMPVVDRWVAAQAHDKRLAMVPFVTSTALVGDPPPALRGGKLKRPALVMLPRCNIGSSSMLVLVGVALSELPSPAQRKELGDSLCKAITEGGSERPQAMTYIDDQNEDRDGLAMAMVGGYSVAATMLPSVKEKRAAFWTLASAMLQKSAGRFEHDHPGVQLRKIEGLGVGAARFFIDAPFGGFDVLTEITAPAGGKKLSDNDLKNYFYEDWVKADLHAQTNLEALIGR